MKPTKTLTESTAGFLHPGQMGVSIAAALTQAGCIVSWASQGRSRETAARAEQYNLNDLVTLDALCRQCRYLFSICPPDQACAVAQQVADAEFDGVFIDCNAVSPATTVRVSDIVTKQGATFVDGGIIGPPALKQGTTRLYLSGQLAPVVAELFKETVVDARVLGPDAGAASALKMAYAGWTKGSAALLMTQFAFAQRLNVEAALMEEWALSQPGLAARLNSTCSSNAPKAWRFTGEMLEIAQSLEDAGLSRLWFEGAADVYQRLSELKDNPDVDRQNVISTLLNEFHTDST